MLTVLRQKCFTTSSHFKMYKPNPKCTKDVILAKWLRSIGLGICWTSILEMHQKPHACGPQYFGYNNCYSHFCHIFSAWQNTLKMLAWYITTIHLSMWTLWRFFLQTICCNSPVFWGAAEGSPTPVVINFPKPFPWDTA